MWSGIDGFEIDRLSVLATSQCSISRIVPEAVLDADDDPGVD
jgi:hypothetical protein